MVIVIILETFIGGPFARKLAFRFVNPKKDRELFVILAIQIMTVCMMCPIMSLVISLIFKGGFNTQLIATWIQTAAINFPMALCWQIFIAGPLVRLINRTVFRNPVISNS